MLVGFPRTPQCMLEAVGSVYVHSTRPIGEMESLAISVDLPSTGGRAVRRWNRLVSIALRLLCQNIATSEDEIVWFLFVFGVHLCQTVIPEMKRYGFYESSVCICV